MLSGTQVQLSCFLKVILQIILLHLLDYIPILHAFKVFSVFILALEFISIHNLLALMAKIVVHVHLNFG